MNHLVKIITDEDGEECAPFWHWVNPDESSPMAFCDGQVFGAGEGHATFESKHVKKGGVTCPTCLTRIKTIKAIRL